MELSIREAIPADVPGIIALTNLVFEENTDVNSAQQIFERTASDENQIHIVAVSGGEIIGFIRAAVIPTMFTGGMGTYAIINHVCVHPETRRGGIATAMLEKTEALCKARGCTALKLWSKNFRQPAHACYRHYGFESIDATFFEKEVK